MERTGLIEQLFRFADALAGWLPGGFGVSTIIACVLFAAISGSSVAAAAAMSVIAIPEMIKRGYPPWLAAGIVAGNGGIAILIIERIRPVPTVNQVENFTPKLALGIGLVQCLAMVPGVSRSGATILGALLMGVTRKTAAEFSFFLAVPTLTGAAVYDLYKNRADLSLDGMELIAIGFVAAFIVSLWIIKWFVDFVSRHGFAPFAWYRIIAGGVLLASLLLR